MRLHEKNSKLEFKNREIFGLLCFGLKLLLLDYSSLLVSYNLLHDNLIFKSFGSLCLWTNK
jgi:hypothetical protein